MSRYHSRLADNGVLSRNRVRRRLAYIAHCDSLAEVSTQQLPCRLPTVALDQTSQGQDSLSAGLSPGHARLLQALGDQGFAGRFHHATGNGQTVADVLDVAHTMSLVAEVGQLGLQPFPFASTCAATMVLQHANDTLRAGVSLFEPTDYWNTPKLGFWQPDRRWDK